MEEIKIRTHSRKVTIFDQSTPVLSLNNHSIVNENYLFARDNVTKKSLISSSHTKIQLKNNEESAPILDISADSCSQHHIQNYRQFDNYTSNLNSIIQNVNLVQLGQLKKKYRFYLSKVQKLENIKQELTVKFNNLDQVVDSSPSVKDEKQSIRFIDMISRQTANRLQQVTKRVQAARQQKKQFNKKILWLRELIKNEKDQFFEMKRKQMKIKIQQLQNEKATKLQNANNTFKNIVSNKINKKKQALKDQAYSGNKLAQLTSRFSSTEAFNKCATKQQAVYSKLQEQTSFPVLEKIQSEHIKHKGRLSCFGNLHIQNILNTNKSELGRLNLTHSQLVRNKNSVVPLIFQTIRDKKNNKNKNTIIQQLNKINAMKEQLISEAYKWKGSTTDNKNNLIKLENSQKKDGIHKMNGCSQKNKHDRKHSNQIQHKILNCSISQNLHTYKQKKQDWLLTGQKTLQQIKCQQAKKQEFLEYPAEKIIKIILQNNKISDLVKIFKSNLNHGQVHIKNLR